jgi:photosystem II stability/assembly factor-like uncharacterized protein
MLQKTLLLGGILFFLTGCSISLPGTSATSGGATGSIYKSVDAGETFVPKVKIDDKKSISSADVLSVAMHPTNSQVIYIGTDKTGMFRTVNSGETWEQIAFPPTKIYGLAIDATNGDKIFATGVYENTGKVYRSVDAGANWKEMYTEPGQGTVITALTLDSVNPSIVYAATSAGVVIRSTDSGDTWRNVVTAKGPVTEIFVNDKTILLTIFNQGTEVSFDQGVTFEDNTKESVGTQVQNVVGADEVKVVLPANIYTIARDPRQTSVYYAGAGNGLFRTADYGKTWQEIDIIESSKKFPIRAIAVNPQSSNEIVYASGGAFYKSIDGGVKWSTAELKIGRGVSKIFYDPANPSTLFFTLRKF